MYTLIGARPSCHMTSFRTCTSVASAAATLPIYNPRGNGQCERYNGIIWSSVKLAVKSLKLHISQWELVLPDVLHSIRSLLCATTNETPHERLFKYKRRSSFGVSARFLHLTWQGGEVRQLCHWSGALQTWTATSSFFQQTQDAATVLWIYRHNSWHAAWPTVILRFMEIRWKTLELSPRKLNKTKFRE